MRLLSLELDLTFLPKPVKLDEPEGGRLVIAVGRCSNQHQLEED